MTTNTDKLAAQEGCARHHLINCSECREAARVRELEKENERLSEALEAAGRVQQAEPVAFYDEEDLRKLEARGAMPVYKKQMSGLKKGLPLYDAPAERAPAPTVAEGWRLVSVRSLENIRDSLRDYQGGHHYSVEWDGKNLDWIDRLIEAAPTAHEASKPDYDALEREHMGDFEKKTGIYAEASKPVQAEAPTASNEREAVFALAKKIADEHGDWSVAEYGVQFTAEQLLEFVAALATQQEAQPHEPWKDHQTAEVINELTRVARKWHGTEQLRARIREAADPLILAARPEPAAQDKEDAEPYAWFWSHGREQGVLMVRQDYEQHRREYPDMVFTPVFKHAANDRPLLDSTIVTMYAECPRSDAEMVEFAREIERAHGIAARATTKPQGGA